MTTPGRTITAFASTALLAVTLAAQTELDNNALVNWINNDVYFVHFDARGDNPVDSILYPGFYTADPLPWIDSLGCPVRLLITCHSGISAAAIAGQIVATGYPADSLFYGGYEQLTAYRFAARDTVPLSLLGTGASPTSLSASELRAVIASRRDFRLMDVRRAAETASGTIPTACVNTWPEPFSTLSTSFPTNVLLILYCASGRRAGQARTFLINAGFDSQLVVNFGGFSKWTSDGGPVAATPTDSCRCFTGVTSVVAGKAIQQVVKRKPSGQAVLIMTDRRTNGDGTVRLYNLYGRTVTAVSSVGTQGVFLAVHHDAPGN